MVNKDVERVIGKTVWNDIHKVVWDKVSIHLSDDSYDAIRDLIRGNVVDMVYTLERNV